MERIVVVLKCHHHLGLFSHCHCQSVKLPACPAIYREEEIPVREGGGEGDGLPPECLVGIEGRFSPACLSWCASRSSPAPAQGHARPPQKFREERQEEKRSPSPTHHCQGLHNTAAAKGMSKAVIGRSSRQAVSRPARLRRGHVKCLPANDGPACKQSV